MYIPGKILPSKTFYDTIAENYDNNLTNDDDNVRNHVSGVLKTMVPTGNVLDFGGGTGLDLPWLTENGYNVFFVEPSENMRAIAKQRILNNPPNFINDNTDIHLWTEDQLPFNEKTDAVLANFAVLNCIENLNEVFNRISLVANQKCYFLATVIDTRPSNIIKNYSLKILLKNLFGIQNIVYNNFNNTGHKTYLHTLSHLKKESGKYFEFISYTPLPLSNFALLILSKK